jgi:uncharacterized protein YpmS
MNFQKRIQYFLIIAVLLAGSAFAIYNQSASQTLLTSESDSKAEEDTTTTQTRLNKILLQHHQEPS